MPFGGVSGADLLSQALGSISARGVLVRAVSSAWESEAQPRGEQPDYVNAVALLDVGTRTPEELYDQLAATEHAFGRTRSVHWGPRTLDLDIVDFAGIVSADGGIITPHPRMHERAFVLAPLAELDPDWRHPVTHAPVAALLRKVEHQRIRRLGALPGHVAQLPQDD